MTPCFRFTKGTQWRGYVHLERGNIPETRVSAHAVSIKHGGHDLSIKMRHKVWIPNITVKVITHNYWIVIVWYVMIIIGIFSVLGRWETVKCSKLWLFLSNKPRAYAVTGTTQLLCLFAQVILTNSCRHNWPFVICIWDQ